MSSLPPPSPHSIFKAVLVASLLTIIALSSLGNNTIIGDNPTLVAGKECRVSIDYPDNVRRWCPMIEEHARTYNLDSNLVAAVMLIESWGDAQAYSPDGAVGLMQVMPKDGLAASFQCDHGPCFSGRPSIEELLDPNFNIEYGCSLLADFMGKTNDLRESLKVYGPAGVGYAYADKVLRVYRKYR